MPLDLNATSMMPALASTWMLDDVLEVNLLLHGELHLGAVDTEDAHADGLANLDEVLGLHVVVVGHLSDVHEALDAVLDLDEGAKGWMDLTTYWPIADPSSQT